MFKDKFLRYTFAGPRNQGWCAHGLSGYLLSAHAKRAPLRLILQACLHCIGIRAGGPFTQSISAACRRAITHPWPSRRY